MRKILHFIILLWCHPLFIIIPDKIWLKVYYFLSTGKRLHIDNPRSYNEKIQWLKLYDRRPIYTVFADKIAVRDYVKDVIGEKYLIPLLGIYNSFKSIHFSALPEDFVLKTNHDSGTVFMIHRDDCTIKKIEKKIVAAMHKNYYRYGREWAYKDIKPMLLVEAQLAAANLLDYKFFCFNGKVHYIQVDVDRQIKHRRNIYDREWNLLPVTIKYKDAWDVQLPPPDNFTEMITIAEKLSAGYPHLRVDLYNICGEIFFGELTLYHGSGTEKFTPEVFGVEMGMKVILPTEKSA